MYKQNKGNGIIILYRRVLRMKSPKSIWFLSHQINSYSNIYIGIKLSRPISENKNYENNLPKISIYKCIFTRVKVLQNEN